MSKNISSLFYSYPFSPLSRKDGEKAVRRKKRSIITDRSIVVSESGRDVEKTIVLAVASRCFVRSIRETRRRLRDAVDGHRPNREWRRQRRDSGGRECFGADGGISSRGLGQVICPSIVYPGGTSWRSTFYLYLLTAKLHYAVYGAKESFSATLIRRFERGYRASPSPPDIFDYIEAAYAGEAPLFNFLVYASFIVSPAAGTADQFPRFEHIRHNPYRPRKRNRKQAIRPFATGGSADCRPKRDRSVDYKFSSTRSTAEKEIRASTAHRMQVHSNHRFIRTGWWHRSSFRTSTASHRCVREENQLVAASDQSA
ncbi:hypothetical protein HPP92_023708 [Vanilla planifolia]|uniref:Uncharacterized protein n=1 Tax=Vanilla planifolia TaxID=51239 RepID=A0A835UC95_VANPL|nr:hypothetical protein HPP92_024050 [Vanilla planifolia]KAG0455920.1 hypothetical protein HPP92_023708 [Vanilla planifolia]